MAQGLGLRVLGSGLQGQLGLYAVLQYQPNFLEPFVSVAATVFKFGRTAVSCGSLGQAGGKLTILSFRFG